ncbi:MAG: hypothetical protein ACI3XG_12395 [Faecousia sp.]
MRKSENAVEKGSPEYHERQVAMGRSALLVVLCLTVLNLVLLIAGSNTYLLFSASVPYYLTVMARGYDLAAYGGVNQGYTWAALAISAVVLGLFLLCWFLSRKTPSWLTAGLVLFVLDTICLALLCRFVFGGFMDSILDFFMHAWVLWELAVGACKAECKNACRPFCIRQTTICRFAA